MSSLTLRLVVEKSTETTTDRTLRQLGDRTVTTTVVRAEVSRDWRRAAVRSVECRSSVSSTAATAAATVRLTCARPPARLGAHAYDDDTHAAASSTR